MKKRRSMEGPTAFDEKQKSTPEEKQSKFRTIGGRLALVAAIGSAIGGGTQLYRGVTAEHHVVDRPSATAEASPDPRAALIEELKHAYKGPVTIHHANHEGHTVLEGGVRHGIIDVELDGTEPNEETAASDGPTYQRGSTAAADLYMNGEKIHQETLHWLPGPVPGHLQLDPRMSLFHDKKQTRIDYDIMVGAAGVVPGSGDTLQSVWSAGRVSVYGDHDHINRIDATPAPAEQPLKVGELAPGDYNFSF